MDQEIGFTGVWGREEGNIKKCDKIDIYIDNLYINWNHLYEKAY
ncbi:hypothetical protein BuS5_01606 [Desulfosarcina sp. BuS5]|nr:hypothetical protein BuS5_01606 [Desulfosarcina sp. BuS5]